MKMREEIRSSSCTTLKIVGCTMLVMLCCVEFVRIELILKRQETRMNQFDSKMTFKDNEYKISTKEGKDTGERVYLSKKENKENGKQRFLRSVKRTEGDHFPKAANNTVYKTMEGRLTKFIEHKLSKAMALFYAPKFFVAIPGPQGPQGPPGKTGDKGSRGKRGKKGNMGLTGPRGPPGKTDDKGSRGKRGKRGFKGPRGPRGLPGPPGHMGIQGGKDKQGVPGVKGGSGQNGASGPRGMQRHKGDIGPKGVTGQKGESSPLGKQSQKGDRGPLLAAPLVIISPSRLTVNESNSAIFHCYVNGYPRPTIVWTKVGGSLARSGSVIGRNGRLEIKHVTSRDSGIYQCKAFNILNKALKTAKLEIYFRPKISLKNGTIYTKVGANVTLPKCHVTGHPKPKVMWYKSAGALPQRRHNIQNNLLNLFKLRKEDSGTYFCKAENILGSVVAGCVLVVVQLPEFIVRPPPSLSFKIGSTFILNCSARGETKPIVSWKKEAGVLPAGRYEIQDGSLILKNAKLLDSGVYVCSATNAGFLYIEARTTVNITVNCSEIYKAVKQNHQVYCDVGGWILIARFSNNDTKNWMRDDGRWWYDVMTAQGDPTNPSANQDMISPAFWLVNGREIKITRSDDFSNTALLRTTSNCLGSRTFRSMITSYGNFRNGKVWAKDKCLGSCNVVYGGQYTSTAGFSQAKCSSGIQSSNKIGFWCDYDAGDGAVMMIGGGGSGCARADHGIGITEEDTTAFSTIEVECDFGDVVPIGGGVCPTPHYALNLWIR